VNLEDITVSVLICTYNRHEMLRQALTALVDGTIEKPDQIVVVNGGDERADRVVSEFVGRHTIDLRLVKTENKNLAASRNVGLPHCTGDIVAMTDDDAEVYPDWVTQIKRLHREHPEAGAVGGLVIGADSQRSLLSRLADLTTFPSADRPQYVRTLPGVNVAYKRKVLEQVGPQDETLFRGEDVDFNWRVQKLGYEIYFHPDMKVIHHHRPTLRRFWQQHYMYGRAYYLVRRKWPDMYCVYPHQLKTAKEWAKALNFIVAALYEPLIAVGQLRGWSDRLRAIPVLAVNHIGWRAGMIHQMLLVRLSRLQASRP